MPPSASRPYRGRPVVGPSGVVRSRGFEPRTSGISGQPLCQVGVRAHGAFGPARTGCLFLTGEALWPGELRRRGCRARTRTSIPWTRTTCLAIGRPGIGTGGGIRTRTCTSFEDAASPVGLRPRAPPESRTPYPPGKSRVLHLYSSRRSEPYRGVEPRWSAWKAGVLAVRPVRRGGSGGDRILDLLLFREPLSRLSYRPVVGAAGFEPAIS